MRAALLLALLFASSLRGKAQCNATCVACLAQVQNKIAVSKCALQVRLHHADGHPHRSQLHSQLLSGGELHRHHGTCAAVRGEPTNSCYQASALARAKTFPDLIHPFVHCFQSSHRITTCTAYMHAVTSAEHVTCALTGWDVSADYQQAPDILALLLGQSPSSQLTYDGCSNMQLLAGLGISCMMMYCSSPAAAPDLVSDLAAVMWHADFDARS
ncbi:hypothetical protein HaLaN_14277 [Haematococcus lacustris]|uniref:Uncharacterized protein n=1 Tax=Haematococcus lacustris TaxID=44745 RepID=A0A699ZE40_HAELA|nr:hypothetical protein HaLaN_14277 [Haematococcus lacustris]